MCYIARKQACDLGANGGRLFSFAHLTDPHLPLLTQETRLRAVRPGKRLSGILSWRMNRCHIHRPEILAATVADISAHRPDHIVLTGDLMNVSLPAEISRATHWLQGLGAPDRISLIPGNHDAYRADNLVAMQSQWRDYMQGDAPDSGSLFPYCRIRGEIALIGISSAVPTRIFSATGTLGPGQLSALDELLAQQEKAGRMRIVMLHHPPGAAGASRHKGLTDRAALLEVLARRGAELVLHGHTHRAVLDRVAGPRGPIPVLAPASASALNPHGENASWHFVKISRTSDFQDYAQYHAQITVRGYRPAMQQFCTLARFGILL